MCHGRFNHSQLLLRGEELICRSCADSLTACSTCKEYVGSSGDHVCSLKCHVCHETFRHQGRASPSPLDPTGQPLCSVCKEKRSCDSSRLENNSTSERVFQCIKCQKSCATENEIKLHILTFHRNETSHRCYLCVAVFNTPAKLQAHLIDHNFSFSNSLACSKCDFQTSNSAELLSHCSTKHNVASKPFFCPLCGQRFFFETELLNHSYSHHNYSATIGTTPESNGHSGRMSRDDKRRSSAESEDPGPTVKRIKMEALSDSESDNDLFCSQCDREFSSPDGYIDHMMRHHAGTSSLSVL